ncbi:MAG: hypothetical protein WC934_05205 [Acidithiobacillus sp.]|jgi:hypothetical protein|uniref:hypothetical protein n=1 Tax=Acidithiobacillus sp. TaxID=1872118 RepID=UPI00355F4C65
MSDFHIPIADLTIIKRTEFPRWRTDNLLSSRYFWWKLLVGDEIILYIPTIGCFHLFAGKHVDYILEESADPLQTKAAAMGLIYSLLIYQRGELPLHGAGVIPASEAKALIICGGVGAGKSTTATALTLNNWPLIEDDVCRLSINKNRVLPLLIHRGLTTIKLTYDACERLNIPSHDLDNMMTTQEKLFFNPPLIGPNECVPSNIIVLYRTAEAANMEWARCSGDVARTIFKRNLYRVNMGRCILGQRKITDLANEIVELFETYVLFAPELASPKDIASELERFTREIKL